MIGDFVFRLESQDPLKSTATLDDIDPKHNVSVLRCANDHVQATEIAEITILVKGRLHTQHAIAMCYHTLYICPEYLSFRNCIVLQVPPLLHWVLSSCLSHSLLQSCLGVLPQVFFVSPATPSPSQISLSGMWPTITAQPSTQPAWQRLISFREQSTPSLWLGLI